MRQAGLTVAFDDFGNMFGSTDGNVPDVPVSMAGSHIDTVPSGGRFDGALGVVGAIESVMAMRNSGCLPEISLEVVVWRCEEPIRFSQGKVGSSIFAGGVTREELRPIEEQSLDLEAALARDGDRPRRAAFRRVASCLELHIEQGRRLERAGRAIGVVTAVAAPIRLRVEVRGSADHSGATPMDERRDALCAAAEIILAVERAGRAESAHESVATSASIACRPGAMNVVPGEATVLIDVRGIELDSMERVVTAIEAVAEEIARRREVEIDLTMLSRGVPTRFEERVVQQMAETVRSLGYEPMLLPSGAGHDVQCLAGMAAAGMLFVPSVGGLSHCPEEDTRPEDVVAGVRSFAACWRRITTL
jgi:N-carbamoyl-L-amino-acid hydrolase